MGIEFEQILYDEGDEMKEEEWYSKKETLGLDFPNLPYFMDGDFCMTESLAIHRYIADKWKPELLGLDI